MKIACQSCQAKYTIADEKVLGKVVKIRCKKCGATIVVNGQSAGDAGGSAEDTGEMSSSGELGQAPGDDGWTVNVADDDQRTMSSHQVVAEFAKGTINDETYCWRDGMGDWLPLREIEELAHACGLTPAASFARQSAPAGPVSVRPATAGSGGNAMAGVFGGGGSPASQRATASATTARRAGGRAPTADLFGSAAEAGGENDVMTSAPSNPNAQDPDGKMTGQRNENSVLFSLNALTTTASPKKKDETTAQGDGYGLIDIRALSSTMGSSGTKKTNHADDIMNLGGGGAFSAALAAPVLTAPPLDSFDGGGSASAQGNKKLVIIVAAIGALAIVAMFSMYMVMRPKEALTATAAEGSSAAASAMGTAPSAPTAPPGATVASNDPVPAAAAPAPEAAKAVAPSVGVRHAARDTSQPSAPAAAPYVPPTPAAAPGAPANLEALMGRSVGSKPVAAAPAGGGGSTDPFDRGAAAGSLGAVDVSSCKKGDGPTGPGHVSITFSPGGTVQTAIVDQPPYAGTAVGGCVAGKFRSAHVPAFAGSAQKVGKSFVIN